MLDGLELITHDNGYSYSYEPVESKPKNELPRVDVARGVFITSRGDEIELSERGVNSLVLERVASQGKPRIPQKEVMILGKHKQMEANESDPGYLALLKEWQDEQNVRVMRYLFIVGVKGKPPEEFVDEQKVWFPDATDLDMKYLWVASRVPDIDINAFVEAIKSRTIPTEKGLKEASDSFPSA